MSNRSSLLFEIGRGGLEGLAGTAVMSLVIAIGHRLGLLTTPPPKQITGRAATKTGVRDDVSHQTFTVGWLAAHVGYGAASGALFRLTRRWVPGPPVLAGCLYGAALWAVSYLGVMPSLGLYPWPREDRASRVAVMVGAHLVYGSVTAVAGQVVSRSRERSVFGHLSGVLSRGEG